MAGVATFDYNSWVTRYPEFASPGGTMPVAAPLAQLYFNEAGIYLDNGGFSPITTDVQQMMLMNMLTAHIAAMNAAGSSPIVGRISSASEGSVSVSSENDYPPGSVQWYQQTKYGAAYWAATAQYRQFKYAPGPVMGVPANQGGGLWSGFGSGSPWRRW